MTLKYRDKKWCFRTNFIINFSKKKKEKKERWGERKQVNGKKEKVGSRGEGRMFRSESMWVVSWHDSYTGFSLSLLVWQSVSSLSWRHYHMMPSSPLLIRPLLFFFSLLFFFLLGHTAHRAFKQSCQFIVFGGFQPSIK